LAHRGTLLVDRAHLAHGALLLSVEIHGHTDFAGYRGRSLALGGRRRSLR
jgi:outer membrane protein OmpA-like peptidoglycan-associated protein